MKTDFDGIFELRPIVFSDSRGYFYEIFKKGLSDLGDYEFLQDNISRSEYGVIRGLHYQVNPFAQGKLCTVLSGEVLDVTIDIRFGSPTFGKVFKIILSSQKSNQLFIAPGFAHGFAVLSDEALFMYKCTNFYDKNSERCILFNDLDLNIDWGIEKPIVSEKDLLGKKFCEIDRDFTYNSKTT